MRFVQQLALALGLTIAAGVALADDWDLRAQLLGMIQTPRLGGDTTRPVATRDAFTFLAPNAPRHRQRPFSFGNRLFNTNWVEAPASVKSFDGLGPQFNRVSCSGCHTKDGRGAAPVENQCPSDSFLLRISLPGRAAHGGPLEHPVYGDQINERSIGGVPAEACVKVSYAETVGHYGDGEKHQLRRPHYSISAAAYGDIGDDILMSPRVAPAVIGLGLLQGVENSTLHALEDAADRDADGISGRLNTVHDYVTGSKAIGRFGWKANQPNLQQQNAAAAIGDIGLTTHLFPRQNCGAKQTACVRAMEGGSPELGDEFLEKLTLYMMTIAVPAQRNADNVDVQRGAALFRTMNCSACHLPALKTGTVAGFPELSRQVIHPFTDLLLHDMGEALADNRPDFDATGSEWRTPPLWGIGLYPIVNGHQDLLHDGRARGVAEAILWHGGEAETAREAFRTAHRRDRDALVAFVNSL